MSSLQKATSLLLLLVLFSAHSSSQLTIELTSIPSTTPSDDPIYIVGNFNNWDPGDESYKLTETEEDTYIITFTPTIGQIEFKFTRGEWAKVEGNENGGFIPNRTINYSGEEQLETLTIAGWEDLGGSNSTLVDNAYVLDESFDIPQLDRTRRIWIYLPPNYDSTEESYPVLYMQDGQNLFDIATSFSGEWEIDESLNELFENGDKGIIVIGIDNGGSHRIDEYSPWENSDYGGGEGDAYVDFIIETLKPHIDNNFRTKPDRLNTGIMGSSLGGLISFYAAIEHQDVFGKAGIFSPSFWFSPKVYEHVTEQGKLHDMKFYFIGGEQESSTLIQNLEDMYNTLISVGFDDSEIQLLTHIDGQHSEWYWKREFGDAYLWLFSDPIDIISLESNSKKTITINPNPVHDTLYIRSKESLKNGTVSIFNVSGELQLEKKISTNLSLTLKDLRKGIYIVNISEKGQIIYSEKILME